MASLKRARISDDGAAGVLLEERMKPVLAKFLTFCVERFEHPVGEEYHVISLLELYGGRFVVSVRENSKNHAAFRQLADRTVRSE